MPELDLPLQAFADINMYFGGVSVATFDRRVDSRWLPTLAARAACFFPTRDPAPVV
jgi:hypothetical protein